MFLAGFAAAAHRTHAYSPYRKLEIHRTFVEKPACTDGKAMDVEGRLRGISAGGGYFPSSVSAERVLACSTVLSFSFRMHSVVATEHL